MNFGIVVPAMRAAHRAVTYRLEGRPRNHRHPRIGARADPDAAEILARLWRVHDLMRTELHERRARAGTMFAVGSGILLGLIAAGLTGFVQDAMATAPGIAVAYLAVLVYSVLAVVASFFGLNPGLPWERERSIEGIAWTLSRLIGATAPSGTETSFVETYDGPLGYRRYARQVIEREPISTSVLTAAAVRSEDLAWRIRALALQIHQLRMWRRFVSAVIAVQFVLVTASTFSLLAIRLEADLVGLTVAAILGSSLVGLVLLVSALGGERRRIRGTESGAPRSARWLLSLIVLAILIVIGHAILASLAPAYLSLADVLLGAVLGAAVIDLRRPGR